MSFDDCILVLKNFYKEKKMSTHTHRTDKPITPIRNDIVKAMEEAGGVEIKESNKVLEFDGTNGDWDAILNKHNLTLINDGYGCFDITGLDPLTQEAVKTIRGPREDSYGDKVKNFTDIAEAWSTHLGKKVECWDVALMMIQVKLARLIKSPDHYDSLVDVVGYLLCYRDIRKHFKQDIYNEAETKFYLSNRK